MFEHWHRRAAGGFTATVLLAAGLAAVHARFTEAADAPGHAMAAVSRVGILDPAELDPAVPAPESILGHGVGERPVRYEALVRYLRTLDEASPRVSLTTYAQTHEGRPLYYLTITSEANHARLDEIQQENAMLADPRRLEQDGALPGGRRGRGGGEDTGDALASGEGASRADRIIERLPGVAWLAYSIHGDELSPTDAAVQVAYELAAGTDAGTRQLCDELVVHIDPLMNPDGRERFLSQLEHLAGKVPNPDYQSMQHSGLWSAGRGNHYLFDLNRDWLMQAHPETRGRAAAMLSWNPHLVVDAHEMGGLSTYLFSPPREPINTYLSGKVRDWRGRFAADHAKAFDRYGWSYYTREWNEEWYPGYTNAWAGLLGAASILYEQARAAGASVKQEAGQELTYHQAVQHQLVSSMVNLATLRANRRELLRDFLADRRWAVSDQGPHNETFLVPPMADRHRHARFVELMHRQGIEMSVADDAFEAQGVVNIWGEREAARTFPPGTLVVASSQPHRRLLHAMLAFDPHMSLEALSEERKKVERREGSKLYDVTAWNLSMAWGLEAWWADRVAGVVWRELQRDGSLSQGRRTSWQYQSSLAGTSPSPLPSEARYGYLVDFADSSVYPFLVRLFERECRPRAALEAFTLAGRKYAPGAILLRRAENPAGLEKILREAAEGLAIDIVPSDTALSEEGPDLGGGRFTLLQPPRVAIASQWPIRSTSFGFAWFALDAGINLRVSPINVQYLRSMDLRKYNVLVLPEVGNAASLAGVLGDDGLKHLKTWVQAGGTLIAIGSAAEFVAGKDRDLSAVRLRHDVLDQLSTHAEAVARETAAREITIDPAAVWGTRSPSKGRESSTRQQESLSSPEPSRPAEGLPSLSAEGRESFTEQRESLPSQEHSGPKDALPAPSDIEALKRMDEWQRMFSPRGAIFAATLDPEHWLCFGLPERLPVLFGGSACYLARHPVRVPARFANEDQLRLSGLCWPEARQRIAQSAYATVESVGYGQIILFAGDPTFRASFEAPARMFLSAVLLGPGLGASTPLPW